MLITSDKAEEQAVLQAAYELCAAVRTAPKARGIDYLDTVIVTDEDKDRLAEEMRRHCDYDETNFFYRDSKNVDASTAIVLVGSEDAKTRGLGTDCSYCHYNGCADCAAQGGVCVFTMIDLGIALGSAAAMASDLHMDNRIMYTIGKAALSLGLMDPKYKVIMGIPLSVTGKNKFFDRK